MPVDSSHIRKAPTNHFARGASVAVRSSFEGSWCSGFEIAAVVREGDHVAGYRLRRLSDRTVLPAVFPASEVIPTGR